MDQVANFFGRKYTRISPGIPDLKDEPTWIVKKWPSGIKFFSFNKIQIS